MNIHQHYGLAENPFGTTPSPKYAFNTKAHQLALTKMLYHVEQRQGIFLLHGAIGTGKTTLARLALSAFENDPTVVVASLENLSMHLEAGFLRAVNAGFGLDTPRNLDRIKELLSGFLVATHQAGKTAVLMIDEAQTIRPLNLSTLHMMSNWQTLNHKLIQIVLLAQPNMARKIEQVPALRSRITGAAHLDPLTFDDAIGLLRHRVAVAAGPGKKVTFEKLFPPKDDLHHRIYQVARGVPRDLCKVCNYALVNAFGLGQKVVTAEALEAAIGDFGTMGFELEGIK